VRVLPIGGFLTSRTVILKSPDFVASLSCVS
jgi:hypothetical protein